MVKKNLYYWVGLVTLGLAAYIGTWDSNENKARPRNAIFADVNGDGLTDIVYTNRFGLNCQLQMPNQTFSGAVELRKTSRLESIASGNLNNNKLADFICVTKDGEVVIFNDPWVNYLKIEEENKK